MNRNVLMTTASYSFTCD